MTIATNDHAQLTPLMQPIRAKIRHPRGTQHAALLTHSDADGENFKALFTAGFFKGATDLITSDQIIAVREN